MTLRHHLPTQTEQLRNHLWNAFFFFNLIHKVPTLLLLRSCLSAVFDLHRPRCRALRANLRLLLIRACPWRLTLRAAFGSLIHKVPTLLPLRSCLSAVFFGAPQHLDSLAAAQPPESSRPPWRSIVVQIPIPF